MDKIGYVIFIGVVLVALVCGIILIKLRGSVASSNKTDESSVTEVSYVEISDDSDLESQDSNNSDEYKNTGNDLDGASAEVGEEDSAEDTSEELNNDEVFKMLVSDKEVSESVRNEVDKVLDDNKDELNKNGITIGQAKSSELYLDSTETCYIIATDVYYIFIYLDDDRVGVVEKEYVLGMSEEDTEAEEISTDVWDVIEANKSALSSYGYTMDDLMDDIGNGKTKMKKTDKDKIYLLTSNDYDIEINANDCTINVRIKN